MKRIFKLAVVAAGLLMTTSAYAVETVVWWDFLTGGDGVRMKALIEKFNEEHKDTIKIEPTTLEWGASFYTKLQTSAAIGKGPDIATYHLSRLPAGVAAGTLAPVDTAALEAAGLKDSDYPPNAIAAATDNGTRYAVPFDVHALVLYYNKSILKDAGLLGDNGLPIDIDTLDKWHAALTKITEGGHTGVVFGTSGGDQRVVYSLFGQMGGEAATDGKFFVGDNEAKLVSAYTEVTSWVTNGWAPPYLDGPGMVGQITSGQAAFMMNGNWELPTLADLQAKGEGIDFGMVEIPTWFDKPASWADSHAFVIPNNVGNPPTPEKQAAVIEVIKWMNKNSLSWAMAGHTPAYLPVVNSPEYKALKPQSDYNHVAVDAFYEPKTLYSGPANAYEDSWANYLSGPMNGEADIAASVDEYVKYLNGL